MRVVECPCGLKLTGADNDELIRRGREHADKDHAGDGITDDFIVTTSMPTLVTRRWPEPR